MHTRASLAGDFRRLGIAAGNTVMLHASVRRVGPVVGGPDQIHLALKDALTGTGTLMMYASCPEHYDEVGRGHLSAEQERELLESLPPFDAATARSARDNGALVELVRTWPDSVVNDHVARFVVWGRHARHVISTQPWDWAFGHGSALERLVELDGRILLLASDIVDVPDKRVARFKVPVLENGRRVWRDMAEFDTSAPAHASWSEQLFGEIVESYLARTDNEGALVGDARSYLIDARGLLAFALAVMKDRTGGRG
jgi:aminoglycoside 3-N-acetyltransferase